jgi:hypothetical protein
VIGINKRMQKIRQKNNLNNPAKRMITAGFFRKKFLNRVISYSQFSPGPYCSVQQVMTRPGENAGVAKW